MIVRLNRRYSHGYIIIHPFSRRLSGNIIQPANCFIAPVDNVIVIIIDVINFDQPRLGIDILGHRNG